jgi:glycosyltransferase involved in cell wall biosynthesis
MSNMARVPEFSILTPSYNQGSYIAQCVKSVEEQSGVSLEHIIADGASTDATLEILSTLRKGREWLSVTSEADGGQADALNRAFSRSHGEVIGWINSDDYYLPNVLSHVAEIFQDPNVMWVVGDLLQMNEHSGRVEARIGSPISYDGLLNNPDIVRQPAAFYRSSALRKVGGWDSLLYMVMDYDLWIRLSRLWQPHEFQRPVAVFRLHDRQKTSTSNIRLQMGEILSILRREGAPWSRRIGFRAEREVMILRKRLKALIRGLEGH